MSTLFYLSSTATSPINPSYSSLWNNISGASRRKMATTKTNSSMTAVLFAESVTQNNYKILHRQYVSSPIAAPQTLSGDVSGQLVCYEDSKNANFYGAYHIRVVDENLNEIGTLCSGVLNTEYNTVAQNRFFPSKVPINNINLTGALVCVSSGWIPDSGSGVPSGAGHWVCYASGYRPRHYIVMEFGTITKNTSSTQYQGNQYFGDGNANPNLPVDETTKTLNNPWVEFSNTISF